MPYTYEYPHMAVAADVVLFARDGMDDVVLLIRRGTDPYKGAWALPGGFIDMDERAIDGAHRELAEETGLTGASLQFLGLYDAVDRDPRERTISLVHWGRWHGPIPTVTGGDDAADARWHYLSDLPPLAFDHDQVIADAVAAFRR